MARTAISVHSIAEAHLLLMVTSCDGCGRGPLEAAADRSVDLGGAAGRDVLARCRVCGRQQDFLFDLSRIEPADASGMSGPARINSTDEPSRAIDLAQWLMLFEGMSRTAAQQTDPAEARWLGYEAAMCLEEALKFYPADSEWPDESAFFSERTLARFREHRHKFARTWLIERRNLLPSASHMRQALAAAEGDRPRRRRRWRFWRRD